LPGLRTIRKFTEVLAVAPSAVEEFREAILKRASRGVPPEILAQAEQMEVDLVDATVIRLAAQRSLREVMQYLVEQGDIERVDRIYREVCGEAVGKEAENDRGAGC